MTDKPKLEIKTGGGIATQLSHINSKYMAMCGKQWCSKESVDII